MANIVFSSLALVDSKPYKIGNKKLEILTVQYEDYNTIYIQVDGVMGQRVFALLAMNSVVEKVLSENHKLKVAFPVSLEMSNSGDVALGFISFQKKSLWERLFSKEKSLLSSFSVKWEDNSECSTSE